MLGCLKYGTALALALALLNAWLLGTGASEEGIYTRHLLVQLHEGVDEDAHQLAAEYGFGSARKVNMAQWNRTHCIPNTPTNTAACRGS